MPSTRRFRRTIIDGSPHYLHSYPYEKLEHKIEKTISAALSSDYSLKLRFKDFSSSEAEPVLRERDRKGSRIRHHLRCIANALTTVGPLTKRLYSEQSLIVGIHASVPNVLDEYDGSEEHKRIVKQHSESVHYIGTDALALHFHCNQLVRDLLCLAVELVPLPLGQSADQRDVSFDQIVQYQRQPLTAGTFDFIFAQLCFLDAQVRLPCQLIPSTGWITQIAGYHSGLVLRGKAWEKYGESRYEVLYRRCFPGRKTMYEGYRHLSFEYGLVKNIDQRPTIFKAIDLFGMATISTYEILDIICGVALRICRRYDDLSFEQF